MKEEEEEIKLKNGEMRIVVKYKKCGKKGPASAITDWCLACSLDTMTDENLKKSLRHKYFGTPHETKGPVS